MSHTRTAVSNTSAFGIRTFRLSELRKPRKRSARGETSTSIADMSTRADSQFDIQNNEPLDSYPERLDAGLSTPSTYSCIYLRVQRVEPHDPEALDSFLWNNSAIHTYSRATGVPRRG